MSYLGIDVGTSAVKVVLIDRDGAPIAEAERRLTTDRRRPGWSEQDADSWIRTTTDVLAELARSAPDAYRGVRSIGISGQMHGSVVLGADARPLRPAILWNDGRSATESRLLNEAVPNLGTIAGVPAMPGFTAPQLLWIRRNEPEIHARIAHVLLPKDYLRLHLTGEYATDLCDGAGSLLVDEAARAWHLPTLEAVGLPPSVLPRLLEGPVISGHLRPEAAEALGLRAGIPVAAGAGDAAAGAIGIGAVEDGDAFVSIGTSSQLFVTEAAYRPHPEALVHAFAHAVPERWFSMAAMLNGASPLAWLAGIVGGGDVGALIGQVEKARLPISPIMALPYLTGERTPHNDPNARGVIFGIDGGTTTEHIAQAVMEGLAFTMMDADRVLGEAGVKLGALAVVGGGARSRLWVEMIASALDRPVTLFAGAAVGPANGAARLARIALTGEAVATACPKPPVAGVVEPSPARRDAFVERYPEFRALYAALKDRFAARMKV